MLSSIEALFGVATVENSYSLMQGRKTNHIDKIFVSKIKLIKDLFD